MSSPRRGSHGMRAVTWVTGSSADRAGQAGTKPRPVARVFGVAVHRNQTKEGNTHDGRSRYTIEARDRAATPYPASDFWTYDYQEAKRRAQTAGLMVIDNTYTFEDSELLDDFTEPDTD